MSKSKGRQSRYEIDGTEEKPATDFHTFITKVNFAVLKDKYVQARIHVPKPIREYMKLKHHDFVQVALRKLPELKKSGE